MNTVIDALLCAAVAATWLGGFAFLRLHTPFERLHVVTFVNVTALGLVAGSAFIVDGITSRSLKCAMVFVTMLGAGALLTHVTGRALHLREGERR